MEADGLSLSQGIADSFGTAFMSMIDGTKSVKEAFKSMAAAIIKQLLQVLVIQQIVGRVGTGGENSGGTGLAGIISKTQELTVEVSHLTSHISSVKEARSCSYLTPQDVSFLTKI